MSGYLPPQQIFRAYDIRGIVGETLTEEGVRLIGQAIGSEAQERGVKQIAVGRDGRLSGKSLCRELISGIRAAGIHVLDIGQVATPMLYFAAHHYCDGSGVMLTGSHNPPQYNGIKIMLAGDTLYDESVMALRGRIENKQLHSGLGELKSLDVFPAYQEGIQKDINLARPLKVVVDGGNGVAGGYGASLLRRLGCETIELFCEVDGNFPNHHPDPNRPENLQQLIEKVAEKGADLGIAFDGDGDRVGVVDEQGKIIWPDRLMMYFAQEILKDHPGAEIIYDVKCTRALADVIKQAGGKPLMWKSGHSYAKAKLKETGALLAGELSGHLFFNDRWPGFDDGAYVAARLVELLSNESQAASHVFAQFPELVSTPELQMAMQEGEPPVLMEKLKQHFPFQDGLVYNIDGLRIEFPEGWALLRASNTTPTLVMRFEALNAAALITIESRIRDWLLEIEPTLTLPF
ncbi:MAG: phosphomannomutase/phosphoglucomutase [Gammaproteobacteria bacterium]|nr:phosphomannomutase/phosphoglucomutase [Gammaproteobacteria bacterium]